ncbi:hypothetical protein AAC387_Pa09g1976 [Persea americana]
MILHQIEGEWWVWLGILPLSVNASRAIKFSNCRPLFDLVCPDSSTCTDFSICVRYVTDSDSIPSFPCRVLLFMLIHVIHAHVELHRPFLFRILGSLSWACR